MKILFVSEANPTTRSVSALVGYARTALKLGHEVAVFGEGSQELPDLPFSKNISKFKYAVFVVHVVDDFPPLPHLARLLDRIPRDRRVVIDCWGRCNDTIRVEHDFNHLEKMDGHQGWEWVDALEAITDKIVQPTHSPIRKDVKPFLFYAFDPSAIAESYSSASQAAAAWLKKMNRTRKQAGLVYVGNNWQRWTQVSALLKAYEPFSGKLGPAYLVGWNWLESPDWAIWLGLRGAEVDPGLLKKLKVKTSDAVPYDEFVRYSSIGGLCPVINRPLFDHLGLVSNRNFETFCADAIPLLMLDPDLVESVYGPAAKPLIPGKNLSRHIGKIVDNPEPYWQAVLDVRKHLAQNHSYETRFKELMQILKQ